MFEKFSRHPLGSWIIMGFSVVAFILVLKLLVSRVDDNGPAGAAKAAVLSI